MAAQIGGLRSDGDQYGNEATPFLQQQAISRFSPNDEVARPATGV
jgi:hypothetical protein